LFPCVSAASICAKVTRDNVLKNWHYKENLKIKEYGSGYPGDPKTKQFLDANIDPVFGYFLFSF
jgi:ribonuclease H2 subunit A